MDANSIGAAAAVAAVLCTVLGALVLLVWKAGRHSQRLDTHELQIGKLQVTQDEHSKAITAWEQAAVLLQEVREDVKALLLRRGRGGGE